MSVQTSILSPVTTGALLYPALHQQIIQVAMPNMVARQFYQQYSLTASNAVVFPKQSGTSGAVINEIGEGAEIILDITPYSNVVATPKKVGQGFVITREIIEDSLLPIQQDQLVRLSLRAANKIDSDCITTIDSGASRTITATGNTIFMDGSLVKVSGSGGVGLGTDDIATGKTHLETGSYMPDSLLMHPLNKRDIERLPHFAAVLFYGKPLYQEGMTVTPGKFGDIMGLDAFASVNVTKGSAYVLSRGRTGNIIGQYSPMGFFVERRPLTTAVKPLEERDSIGIYVTARYIPVVTNGNTIAKIGSMTTT